MNPHYNPYSDLNSPHSPGSDNNNYPPLGHHNGHSTLSQMDGHHQGFHHINNNGTNVKHCAGCGGKLNFFSSILTCPSCVHLSFVQERIFMKFKQKIAFFLPHSPPQSPRFIACIKHFHFHISQVK
jgi:hypothetical protein